MKLLKRIWNWITGRRSVPAPRPVQEELSAQPHIADLPALRKRAEHRNWHHSRGKSDQRWQN